MGKLLPYHLSIVPIIFFIYLNMLRFCSLTNPFHAFKGEWVDRMSWLKHSSSRSMAVFYSEYKLSRADYKCIIRILDVHSLQAHVNHHKYMSKIYLAVDSTMPSVLSTMINDLGSPKSYELYFQRVVATKDPISQMKRKDCCRGVLSLNDIDIAEFLNITKP